ncbi:hypothetical protein MJO29_004599, partial [Puccinia striiformis f. sp. tritici]
LSRNLSGPQEWMKPSKKHGPWWEGFLMTDLRNNVSRQRCAKCTHCQKIFNQAKPQLLFSHIKDICPNIPAEQKLSYLNSDLHKLLVKSLISSNLPFSFFENPYFQEYQLELAQSVYKIPCRVQVIEKILPVVHAQHKLLMLNQIKEQKQLTLSLDGWTDNSGSSIYTLMALKGAKQKYFINILDLNHKQHTAENIFLALKGSLASKQIGLDQVCAVVTDSPLVMLKLCRLLNNQSPHILKVHCTLHVFNLIAKRVVNHPTMEAVVKKNKKLVNYFTNSSFWREHLTTWQKENDVKHGLQTLCTTRWYSMAKACLEVQSHKIGFKKCLKLLQNKQVDTPSMTDAVVKLLKPVVDAIGHLECADTTLADIWKEMIQTYKSICDGDVYSRVEPFKQHCLDVLHSQTKTFHGGIYTLFAITMQPFRTILLLAHGSLYTQVGTAEKTSDWHP